MPIHLGSSKSAITGYKRPASSSRLPVDNPDGANTVASLSTVSVSLSVEETVHCYKGARHRTEINDVLLTALVQTFTQWTRDTPYWWIWRHGREAIANDIDLSRTMAGLQLSSQCC